MYKKEHSLSPLSCCRYPSRRDIPRQSYMMHTLHCARNIALCADCDEPVPRAELEDHMAEFHSRTECELCNQSVEACKMETHQVSQIFPSH